MEKHSRNSTLSQGYNPALTTFRMNTYEKQGEGGQLLLTRRRI